MSAALGKRVRGAHTCPVYLIRDCTGSRGLSLEEAGAVFRPGMLVMAIVKRSPPATRDPVHPAFIASRQGLGPLLGHVDASGIATQLASAVLASVTS